jgi:hypothetical protein
MRPLYSSNLRPKLICNQPIKNIEDKTSTTSLDAVLPIKKYKRKRNYFSNIPFFSSLFRSNRKKILILMSDTGGGHRASAEALHQAINEHFPRKFNVDIMDIWTDHATWPFNRFVPTYRFLAKHPMLWRGFYAYGAFPPTKLFTEFCSWTTSYSRFAKAIEAAEPDVVVSVHPLCQLMPISIVKAINQNRPDKPKIPFVTVVTDLGGAHTTWFDKRVDAVCPCLAFPLLSFPFLSLFILSSLSLPPLTPNYSIPHLFIGCFIFFSALFPQKLSVK